MPKAPLLFEHMVAIAETLEAFSCTKSDSVKLAVCLGLKIKVEKKLVGLIPTRGYRITLTAPELELVKQLNQLYAFGRNVRYANSYLRLLEINHKK
jgi:hypothetical protein